MYYIQSLDLVTNKHGVKQKTGVDVNTTGIVGLNNFGIYPVTEVTPPYNEELYDVATTYTLVEGLPDAPGTYYAQETYTPTAKTLADVLDYAQETRIKTLVGIIRNRRIAASHNDMSVLVSGSNANNYAYWTTRASNSADALDSELYSITNAATVDAVNNIVSAATGTIAIMLDEANPLNLLESDFDEFYSKNYAESDLELYFPGTDTTVAYSSGFAATAGAVSADDPTVQLRVTATGVVIDELALTTCDAADFTAYPENYLSQFGYHKYANVDISAMLDAAAIVRSNSVNPKFTGVITAPDVRIQDGGQYSQIVFAQRTGTSVEDGIAWVDIAGGGQEAKIVRDDSSEELRFYSSGGSGTPDLVLDANGYAIFGNGLTDAADDTAAAAANVPVNGLYRNGSVVMIRVS